jgi:hypothetical protein
LDGPALILGDDMSVVLNTTVPSSVLKKKHNAIVYHCVREAIAARILRFANIKSGENVSDLLTNQGQGRFLEVLLLLHFRFITFLTSLRFLQYHGSIFCFTYHSSCSRQNILRTSYKGIPCYNLNRDSTEISEG